MARTIASRLSIAPDTQPWSALLDAGRSDERLVHEAFEGAREAVSAPLPDTLHPALLAALRANGIAALW
ncbi:MAG: box helicase protein, partial [Solirubrobacteraceae bacterium]|nr:box helicase protein [Solirubrobacteraceae bacterium]